ncbi:hypothetical protein L798_10565 [Zootermopsis nevadensis]|uniref:Uncharacterized protein n=1 Tax=Zootermopsis nevadensis TaxID=136037 RepID=A0A067R7I1_ZOONE|nr:hypothetical protein L798_10565 [Zootermopsis nevadensis]
MKVCKLCQPGLTCAHLFVSEHTPYDAPYGIITASCHVFFWRELQHDILKAGRFGLWLTTVTVSFKWRLSNKAFITQHAQAP